MQGGLGALTTQDGAAPAQVVVTGVQLADPSTLPADGVAGKIRRALATLKGIYLTWRADTAAGEDLARQRQLVEVRTVQGDQGVKAASASLHSAACRVAYLRFAAGAGGVMTVQLRDGGAGGTVMTPTFSTPASTSVSLPIHQNFSTSVYATIGGAGASECDCTIHTSTVA